MVIQRAESTSRLVVSIKTAVENHQDKLTCDMENERPLLFSFPISHFR
jgi:hypothetical protein